MQGGHPGHESNSEEAENHSAEGDASHSEILIMMMLTMMARVIGILVEVTRECKGDTGQ